MEGVSAYRVVSIFCTFLSLVCTTIGLFMCFTQNDWKKRDGVLRYGIFTIDVVFSCIVMSINVLGRSSLLDGNKYGVIVANIFAYVYLLSWAVQCLIAINRFIVIIYSFTYMKVLNRYRLSGLVYCTCILTAIACIVSSILTEPSHLDDDAIYFEYQMILLHLSKYVIKVILPLHSLVLLVILAMECYLWKIARGHQRRYRSTTNSVSSKDGSYSLTTPTANSLENQNNRRFSATKALQKHLSFAAPQRMAVRRMPFLILALHFSTIIPYITLGFIYAIDTDTNRFVSKCYRYTGIYLLVANTIRPIINFCSELTNSRIRRFKLFLQKLVDRESAELCTEYYIENQKEVKTLFKLRRESAQSLVTEGIVV